MSFAMMSVLRRPILGLLMVLFPVQLAAGTELQCLGTGPGFMLVLEGETARFDYLGDGVFGLSPPLSETAALPGFAQFALETSAGPLPVYVERRACPSLFGLVLPFSVEIGIQSSQGRLPMFGCCREGP